MMDKEFLVLGIAFDWGERKGLDIFLRLADDLDERYKIVLIGSDDETDKIIPHEITSIHRTQNQEQLANLYTSADVFVNPTREDNFPTVNLEALACGTPVLTFRTGGSPESLTNDYGAVVACEDYESLLEKVKYICEKRPFCEGNCLKRAADFDRNDKFREYLKLFDSGY